MEYLWKIFMWAQNSLWACVGIYFCEWANEIRAQKFVPQHLAPGVMCEQFLIGHTCEF